MGSPASKTVVVPSGKLFSLVISDGRQTVSQVFPDSATKKYVAQDFFVDGGVWSTKRNHLSLQV